MQHLEGSVMPVLHIGRTVLHRADPEQGHSLSTALAFTNHCTNISMYQTGGCMCYDCFYISNMPVG
jgi:hypothetical protein